MNPNEVDITFRFTVQRVEAARIEDSHSCQRDGRSCRRSFRHRYEQIGRVGRFESRRVQTRYKNPREVLQKIVEADKSEITALLQRIYQESIQEDLIAARVRQIKDGGVLAAVSSIPQRAAEFGKIAQEAGADIFVWYKALFPQHDIFRQVQVA